MSGCTKDSDERGAVAASSKGDAGVRRRKSNNFGHEDGGRRGLKRLLEQKPFQVNGILEPGTSNCEENTIEYFFKSGSTLLYSVLESREEIGIDPPPIGFSEILEGIKLKSCCLARVNKAER